MLLHAVVESQRQTVSLEGYNREYSRLLVLAGRGMAIKLGLDPDRIVLYSPRVKADVRYTDHFRGGNRDVGVEAVTRLK